MRVSVCRVLTEFYNIYFAAYNTINHDQHQPEPMCDEKLKRHPYIKLDYWFFLQLILQINDI